MYVCWKIFHAENYTFVFLSRSHSFLCFPFSQKASIHPAIIDSSWQMKQIIFKPPSRNDISWPTHFDPGSSMQTQWHTFGSFVLPTYLLPIKQKTMSHQQPVSLPAKQSPSSELTFFVGDDNWQRDSSHPFALFLLTRRGDRKINESTEIID